MIMFRRKNQGITNQKKAGQKNLTGI